MRGRPFQFDMEKLASPAQMSTGLSPELWAQVDDLIQCFGDNRSEVLGFILRSWLAEHEAQIVETKARVDRLMKRESAESVGG